MQLAHLRHITLILAMLGILFSTQGGLLAHLLFYARQEFVARHLCENRHIPHKHCHGKCFLKKRLAESAKQSESGRTTLAVSPVAPHLPAAARTVPPPPERPRPAYAVPPDAALAVGFPSHVDPPPRAA